MCWVSASRNSFSGRAAAAAVVALWLLAGCTGQESPEQQIRTMLDSAARAVEQRALNQVNTSLGFESGFIIVVVAIMLDRMLRVDRS